MTSDKHKPTLTNIPLEVRHHIFEYVASHDTQPKKLLRYWFEKKEVREKTAELAAKNGGVGAPRVVYAGDQFEHEEFDMEDGEEWEDSGEDDSDEDGDEDGDEDSDEDGDEEEEEEEDEEEDGDDAVPTAAASLNAQPAGQANAAPAAQITASVGASLVAGASQGLSAALAAANAAMQTSMATVAALHTPTAPAVPAQVQGQAGDEEEGSDADMSEDGEEEDVDMDGEDEHEDGDEDADSDEEMEQDDDADFGAVAVQADSPSAPVVTAHGKWRHIPKFMRITHCPPPVELLLTSKQLNAEAKSWFYDVVALRIDATGSFAHTSFFEEAFSQITEAAFSPMEDIRKVEVTFVWDTTWLRSEEADCAAAIFPALLRQRAHVVTSILAQAPSLNEVTVHWHDSAHDGEAVDLMNDVLTEFLSLNADVKVEPHYIAADAKPHKKSVAGQQRLEFQRIVDNGLDRLF